MEKFSPNIHETQRKSALQMAQTDTAKQLVNLLTKSDNQTLQEAFRLARNGEISQAAQLMQQVQLSDEAMRLLRKLQEDT